MRRELLTLCQVCCACTLIEHLYETRVALGQQDIPELFKNLQKPQASV